MRPVALYGATVCVLAMAMGLRPAHAELKLSSQGELGLESRGFFPQEAGKDYNVAVAGRMIVDGKLKPLKMKLRGFFRYDLVDSGRSAAFPEEAYLEYKRNPLRLRVGYQMFTWSATEAFHPADIMNSRYLDGNVQSPEKLGELAASARLKFGNGNIELLFMPRFEEPIYPSSNSRYRFGPRGSTLAESLVLDEDGELTDDRWFPQYGVRVQQTVWDADLSAHVVRHIDRSMPLSFAEPPAFVPHLVFQSVIQAGGTYQQVLGPIIAKLEGAYRWFDPPSASGPFAAVPKRDHGLVAVGFEWGLPHESGGESTLLLEGQSVYGLDSEESAAAFLLFQRDVLVGYRFAANSVNDDTFTMSTIVDLDNRNQVFVAAEYGRRLGETWRSAVGLRLVQYPPQVPGNPVGAEYLDNVNYGYLNLTRFF